MGADPMKCRAIKKSAAEIGSHGYAYWTDKPLTPNVHTPVLVPQTIADGWESYCSCGNWSAFASVWDTDPDLPARRQMLDALNAAFQDHVKEAEAS
jgi:hypothetical protein